MPAKRAEVEERLGYSLNLFPSETIDDVKAAVEGPMREVALRLGAREGAPLPVEARLGMPAIETLEDPAACTELRDCFSAAGLDVFTMNGFPISGFHEARVKEDVFRPSWLEPERLAATIRLGEITARLVGDASRASVSTLTGSFKEWGDDDEIRDAIAVRLARAALAYHRSSEETGTRLVLCVEPEPLNTFENRAETIELFERLDRAGAEDLVRSEGLGIETARSIIREHLGVNFDTCHFSIQFEDVAETLDAFAREGIAVSKIHLSNALVLDEPGSNAAGLAFLKTLDEPRYLHQVVAVDREGVIRWRDRDVSDFVRRPAAELEAMREARVHFHLPLFLESGDGFRTTHADTAKAYRFARARGSVQDFAIETYTFGILIERERIETTNLVDGICREFEWVHELRETSS